MRAAWHSAHLEQVKNRLSYQAHHCALHSRLAGKNSDARSPFPVGISRKIIAPFAAHSSLRAPVSFILKNYLQLNFSLLYWIFVAPFTGQFFKIAPIFRQMVFIGVRAAPMVALTAFSVGVTLAMQAAHSLETLGAEMYIPDLVMLTLLREMGPVLIAVIVIGRSGSAVAAEIGTMKVSEEIEALEVMAINPVQFLVVPRFLAMMVMLPALTIFGNYIGILGGWAVCVFALDFNTAGYILRALESAEPGICIPE